MRPSSVFSTHVLPWDFRSERGRSAVALTGLPIKIQPGLKLSGKIERPAARQVSLATMLAETLDPLGLSYTSHRGNLWIGNADFTALQKKLAEQSRQVLAAALEERAKLLGRAVNTTFEDMPMHQLGDRLSRAIGMPVRIGPKAWKLAKPVTLRTKGMTLGEFGRWLSQQLDGKITLIVAEETVYLVSD